MAEANPKTPRTKNGRQEGTDGKSIQFISVSTIRYCLCMISCKEEDTAEEKYPPKDVSKGFRKGLLCNLQ